MKLDLVKVADYLLVFLTIDAFILTYAENYTNQCFEMKSFILATILFFFSLAYSRWISYLRK